MTSPSIDRSIDRYGRSIVAIECVAHSRTRARVSNDFPTHSLHVLVSIVVVTGAGVALGGDAGVRARAKRAGVARAARARAGDDDDARRESQ